MNIKTRSYIIAFLLLCFGAVQAQNNKVSLNVTQKKVEEVLLEIKNQTSFDFIFNDNLIDAESKVSLNVQDENIEEVLKQICKPLGWQYKIIENTIILKPLVVEENGTSVDDNLLRQTIRGQVFENHSNATLPGATVILKSVTPNRGTTTDEYGNFSFKNVPIGRHSINVSFVGYQPGVVSEILLISAKESMVKVSLEEASQKMGEVTVTPTIQKDKPLNPMAAVSARSFTVEESQRYAGGLGDPTRLASSFAGVSASYDLTENGISVRGQRPGAIVWRLEDVEIPNPNHFAGAYTAGAGFACLISNQLMDNSDFYTGAFPAEIGNSLSAAFDLQLRTGNNNQREYTFQIGVLGIDFASEGPFKKGGKASYNINYRYSTLGLLGDLGILGDDFLPRYQDLTYKFNFPTNKFGTITFWGTGGIDYLNEPVEQDSSLWATQGGRYGDEININMGATGLAHRINIGKRAFVKTSLVASTSLGEGNMKYIDDELLIQNVGYVKNNTNALTLSSFISSKLGSKLTNRTGINIHKLYYDIHLQSTIDDDPATLYTFGKSKNSSYLAQAYTQSKYHITPTLNINAGLHFQYFILNDNYTIEPRFGLNWQIKPNHLISAGYGMHSQLEELRYYFIENVDTGEYLNKDLDFAKAHHFVLAYDWRINEHTRLKLEPYFQKLYNYPGIPDSCFSMINMEQDWLFDENLENVTSGTNYGIDVTLEQFLHKNFYYLITGSLFKAKYTGDDNVTRNARFDRGYTANLLVGKEFHLRKNSNNILSANFRINAFGGKRKNPVDWDNSYLQEEIVYDYNHAFEEKEPFRLYIDVTVRLRRNHEKYTETWSLEILNLIPVFSKRPYYNYNEDTDTFTQNYDNMSLVPVLSYKIEF